MDFPISASDWLLASLVIVLASTVQGIIGYGIGVFGVPLLYLIYPGFIPAPLIMIGMLLPLMIVFRDHKAVIKRDILWALPGLAVGTFAAALVIEWISPKGLGVFLGTLVLVSVGISLLREFPDPRPPYIGTAAALSGFMGTITAIGGPPLSLVFQKVSGPRLPGTLSAIFVPGGILSLTALYSADKFGPEEFVLGASLIPSIALGYWLSGHLNRRLPAAVIRPAVLSVSSLAALLILYRSLFSGTG